MNKKIISILFLLNFYTVVAQQDVFIKEISRNAVVIDSLKKTIKSANETVTNKSKEHQKMLKSKNDSIRILQLEISKLVRFKADMNKADALAKQQKDSIRLLMNQLTILNKVNLAEKQKCQQSLVVEKENRKNEIVSSIVNTYTNRSIDELIEASSKSLIQRDLLIVNGTNDVATKMNYLILYFKGKSLLEKRYNFEELKTIQLELNQIKQPSVQLDKLKRNINKYQTFNQGLIECFDKINLIDEKEIVKGLPEEIINQKRIKIIAEISNYIFDYDFNFMDYPYLSDIMLKVINLKKPNPDADISILINNIN